MDLGSTNKLGSATYLQYVKKKKKKQGKAGKCLLSEVTLVRGRSKDVQILRGGANMRIRDLSVIFFFGMRLA